jgi:hypothetical protein
VHNPGTAGTAHYERLRHCNVTESTALVRVLADALAAGARVTFTRGTAGWTVTVTHGERTSTGHGETLGTALQNALAVHDDTTPDPSPRQGPEAAVKAA